MGKSDNKTQVLGDDPLAWLTADTVANKKTSVKKKSPLKKSEKTKSKKAKSEKTKSEIIVSGKDKAVKAMPKKKSSVKKIIEKPVETSSRLELESSIVINKAGEIYKSLNELTASGQDVEIDASKVEIIDSAILQMFFSFALSLKENKIKLTWYKPTEGLINKAATLGLQEQLGL